MISPLHVIKLSKDYNSLPTDIYLATVPGNASSEHGRNRVQPTG